MRELLKANRTGQRIVLIEIATSELVSNVEQLNEMKLKGLETFFLVNKQASKWTAAILVALASVQSLIGLGLALTPFNMLGMGFLSEGLADFITAGQVLISGHFDIIKYLKRKAFGMAFNLAFSSFGLLNKIQNNTLFKVRNPFLSI